MKKMKTKTQITKSALLEGFVQVSSVAISFYLIDMRGYPFLANSVIPNANLLPVAFPYKQILDI